MTAGRACGVGLGLGVDGAEDLELVGVVWSSQALSRSSSVTSWPVTWPPAIRWASALGRRVSLAISWPIR
jgi:hypothetical protein